MRILAVPPGSGRLVVLADRREDAPSLTPGARFLAEIVAQDGAQVVLDLAGHRLRCETALPLEPGTSVWMAVKETSSQRVVLTPTAPPSGAPDEAQLPTESLISPAAAGPAAPGHSALARAVQYLLANSRPTTPEAVEAVAPLLAGQADLGEAVARLAALLSDTESAECLPPPLRHALNRALEGAFFRLPAADTPNPASPTEQAAALKAVVSRLGLDYEASLAEGLTEDGPGCLERPVALKGVLLLARQALAEQAAPAAAPPPAGSSEERPLPPLARAVEDTLHNLTAQRLVAPATPDPATGASLELYLQLPITVGDQRHTAELRVYREGRRSARRAPGETAFTVSCRLSTSYLGPVRVDLGLRPKGATTLHLFLAAEEVAALFRAHEPELRATLGRAGLKPGQIAYTVAAPPPAEPDTQGQEPTPAPPGTIDLRL